MGDEKPAENKKNNVLDSFRQAREKGSVRNRFLAAVIDFVIIGFLCQISFALFGAPDLGAYVDMQEVVQNLARDAPEVIERMKLWQEFITVAIAIGVIYEAMLLVLFGGTAGKLIFGFRVVSATEGRNTVLCKLLLILRAAVKGLSIYLLSAIPFIFLCLTTFGNAEARSGFDLFARTKVLYKKSASGIFKARS